jgi:hypothetical protein
MQSTGAIHFRPCESKFLTFHTADIAVRAHMCCSCGSVTLLGDAEKLRLVKNLEGSVAAGAMPASPGK